MYAVLRLNSFDPAKLMVSADRLEEFDKLHAAQPGYVGSVVVDLGAGRRFALNLWETEQHSAAALQVLGRRSGGCSVRSWPPRHSSSGPGQCSLQI